MARASSGWTPFGDDLPREAAAALEGPRGLAEAPLGRALRRFRQAVMLRILAQDFAGLRTLAETTESLSALADFCLERALAGAEARLGALWGTPEKVAGVPQRIAILALGKLGERALNLSSDIDLMAVYEAPRTLPGGRTYQAFYVRVLQDVITLLDARTAEGFVFRVDFRLRPLRRERPPCSARTGDSRLLRKPGAGMGALCAPKGSACGGRFGSGGQPLRDP